MGTGKWDHIRALCNEPQIADRYAERFGRAPTDDDVTAIYERFMPLQIERIAEHSGLIPGALEAVAALRARGIKIGSCSGYPACVMEACRRARRGEGLRGRPRRGERRGAERTPRAGLELCPTSSLSGSTTWPPA
ncbi:hypothetical protein ACU4GR_05115 [Methylobacterium oryzae CBMB20]